MNKIPKIIAGQNFTVNVDLSYFGTATENKFDLTTCTEIVVNFLCSLHTKKISMPYEVKDYHTIIINCDGSLLHSASTYGLEITGKDKDSQKWRFKLKPYEFLMVVDATSEISNTTDWGEILTIDLNGRIGFDAPWQEGNILEKLDNKVDKVAGKSLISDTEIERLSKITNTDTTEITKSINDEISARKSADTTLQTNIDTKVDKVDGKSLISDTEITRLASVSNYDDTAINKAVTDETSARKTADTTLQTNIDKKQDTLVSATNIKTINGASILGSGNITTTQDLSSYATTSYVNTQDEKKVDKVTGKSLLSDTEIERLSKINNYDDSVLKASIATKVDKVDGKSLVSDVEITRLSKVTNYDDTDIKSSLATEKSTRETADTTLQNNIDTKVDKVAGKSLLSDTEITRLSTVTNYDDTDVKSSITDETSARKSADTTLQSNIDKKQDTLVSATNIKTINGSSILGSGNIVIDNAPDLTNYATTSYVNAEDTKLQTNIDTKVDKVDGKSLISNTEITRLAGVSNYDDTAINKAVTDEASLRLNNDLLIKTDLNSEITRAKKAEADITASIPTKVSQLTNDSNYQTYTQVNEKIKAVVGAAPEALDTLEEIAKQMATDESAASSITTSITNLTTRVSTNEANISNKVDKVDGKSLISDTEITRLSTVTNYDDTNITKSVSDEKSDREAADTTLQNNINAKQATLVSGTNIKTINGTSILGSGNISTTQDLSSYATISYVNAQDENKVDKVDGKSLISDTEITRLSTVTNYDDTNITKSVSDETSAREAADITLQTNIDKKVDKVTGKSLISDTEITRLASVTNYDDSTITKSINDEISARKTADTTLQTNIDAKVDKVSGKSLSTNDYTTDEKTKLANLTNYDDSVITASIATKVDKVDGKSLISDTEITRLASVSNYDDTDVKSLITTEASNRSSADTTLQNNINAKQATLVSGTNIKTINGTSILGSGNISTTQDLSSYATTTAMNSADTTLQTNINAKQDKLVSATNIKTINGATILGSGNIVTTAADTVDGYHIAKVEALPATTDENTIYILV